MKYVASNTYLFSLKAYSSNQNYIFFNLLPIKIDENIVFVKFDATFIIICNFLSNKRHFCSKRVFEG